MLFGKGTRPAAILLTHIHPDHSGSALELARIWDLPVHVHPRELPLASGRYLPQYGNPLDRWLIAPLLRQTSGTLTFAADGDGTVMSWDWQVHPKGWMRMPGPLFGPLGGRMERGIWTSMKRYLENTAARPVTRPTP